MNQSTESVLHIGFVGTGVMGGPMAKNLLRAGYRLSVSDLDRNKTEPLQALGATWCDSVADLCREVDVLMTSLPGPKQIEQVAFGEGGVFENLASGKLWIELSTNNLEVAKRLDVVGQRQHIDVIDAPVSGGDEGASAADLTILVGGSKEAYERALPVLKVIGKKIEHLGPHGAGYCAKIAQVLLCYVHTVALAEALMLGIKGGVDAGKMLEVIRNSAATSYVANRYGPCILDGDYDSSFTLELALKDMRLAQALASSVGSDLPMVNLTTDTFAHACDKYGGKAHHLMVMRLLEEANKTLLRNKDLT